MILCVIRPFSHPGRNGSRYRVCDGGVNHEGVTARRRCAVSSLDFGTRYLFSFQLSAFSSQRPALRLSFLASGLPALSYPATAQLNNYIGTSGQPDERPASSSFWISYELSASGSRAGSLGYRSRSEMQPDLSNSTGGAFHAESNALSSSKPSAEPELARCRALTKLATGTYVVIQL